VTSCIALLTLGCRGDSQGRGSALDSVPGSAAAVGDLGPMSVLDSTITSLRFSLESIDEAFESLPDELRADSGSARADTAVLRLQAALDEMVVDVVKTFNDAEFQALMWPEGARGERLSVARKRAGQEGAPADPRIADSLRVFLDAHGIWSYRAEGDTYFVLSLARFLQATSPFITEGAREALRIALLEQLSPSGGDAAVTIPWDSLGDRLSYTDRFLARFPEAAARNDIRDRRDRYRDAFFTGWDNTNVFGSTGVLDPKVRASFERYVQRHGSTESAALVRTYLELLAKSQYRRTPEIDEFLRTHVELEHR
jgi:hypothetical protein